MNASSKRIDLHSGDDLADIGCGDGTLLRMAAHAGVRTAMGLLATEEEVAVLRRAGLNVKQGVTEQLPVPNESASVVVCNNVLLVVPRQKIAASLREIHRIDTAACRNGRAQWTTSSFTM
jgi:ubiquinone/menaquinone biosynthesis C-methylase UbiE